MMIVIKWSPSIMVMGDQGGGIQDNLLLFKNYESIEDQTDIS